ncbi:MAG TPA: CmcJ/NvfI family oxidoreductase [Burkholderiales bacterium]|nr:CmcJ/NvfI family oxidoreductase [Burkholderiales bacterium]
MQAEIRYTRDTGEPLVNETFGPNNIRRRTTGAEDLRRVEIGDGRAAADLSLETSGFVLVRHASAVRDFFDVEELKRVYYPEVEALIGEVCGAKRVVVFDHTLRSGDEAEREARLVREPVLSAHNDYTEWSGPQRVRELMGEEAAALLERRFAIVQAWRPLVEPLESNPLAMADARSVAPEDLLLAERRYPHRVGQTYRVKYSPRHRWYYFPRMRRDEAIVFKVFDSATDGRARFTPHTAFDDPGTRAGAPPRQSIEARALAFF